VRKSRRRLRRTWGTTGEVLAWIATRDRRRVDDQKVSARAPSKDLEYTRQYFKREPAADWLALIKSAAETTYAKGVKDAPRLGAAFADAAQSLEDHVAAKRIVEHAGRFRWAEVEDIWPPKARGRPSVDTLNPKLIERLVDTLLSKGRDEYAEKGRAGYAMCRWQVLKEIGVEVDKRLIKMFFDTALAHAERRLRPAAHSAEVKTFGGLTVTVHGEDFSTAVPSERQIENLRSWRRKGAPRRKFGI
jgi:hypothetical protein